MATVFCKSTGEGTLDLYGGGFPMVRRSVLAMFAVMAIVLGGVVVSTPAGAEVDTAVVVPSPHAGTSNLLSSVSCVGASACVAVGGSCTNAGNAIAVLSMTGPVPPSTISTLSPPDQVVPAFTG